MLSPCNQEDSADAALQFQFTAYLQTALRRQQQRSQARLDRMRSHECESEMLTAEPEYSMPDDSIKLELARLPLREQKILLLHVLNKQSVCFQGIAGLVAPVCKTFTPSSSLGGASISIKGKKCTSLSPLIVKGLNA